MEQESCARALEGDVARSLCVPQPAPPAQFHAPPPNGLVVPQVLARCVSQNTHCLLLFGLYVHGHLCLPRFFYLSTIVLSPFMWFLVDMGLPCLCTQW